MTSLECEGKLRSPSCKKVMLVTPVDGGINDTGNSYVLPAETFLPGTVITAAHGGSPELHSMLPQIDLQLSRSTHPSLNLYAD